MRHYRFSAKTRMLATIFFLNVEAMAFVVGFVVWAMHDPLIGQALWVILPLLVLFNIAFSWLQVYWYRHPDPEERETI